MKRVYYLEREKLFKIVFSGKDFRNTLENVRSIPGRIFDIDLKYWTCPVNEKNYLLLRNYGFEFMFENGKGIEEIINNFCLVQKKETIPVDKSKLGGYRNYQIDAVQFVQDNNGYCVIADPMGVGKTIEAIGYLKIHPELRPALIVCPAFLKINWQREIDKWLGERSVILNGKDSSLFHHVDSVKIYIINYDILGKRDNSKKIFGWYKTLQQIGIKAVVFDECQYISSSKSIRTKAAVRLTKTIKDSRMFLSGTPIKNKPSEFYTVLNLVDPVNFPSRWSYLNEFCDPKNNGFGLVFNGLTNWGKLRNLIKPIMIRRKKSDVLKELPEKNNIIVDLKTDEKCIEKYKEEDNLFREWAKSQEKINKAKAENFIEKLKQLAYLAKRDSVIKWIGNFLQSGEKLVIGAYHRKVIDDIVNHFNCDKIDGSVKMEDRQMIIDKFQTDKNCKLLIGQIQAMGVGITLTAASNMAVIEFGWTPADHDQLSDRLHRIGQKADSVNIYYLVAFDTVEQSIIYLLQHKAEMVNKVLDGDENRKHFDPSVLNDIISFYGEDFEKRKN